MVLTIEHLIEIMPRLRSIDSDKLKEYFNALTPALIEFEIIAPLRVAAFLAQIAHESGQLKYWEEIWGPTPAQKGYEGRADLGNTEPGDGYKYRGRGPIQITGRDNYKHYGALLNLHLIEKPDLAALPENGFRIAACYWKTHGLNELADGKVVVDFRMITRRINGGYSHLFERLEFWEKAKKTFGVEAEKAP